MSDRLTRAEVRDFDYVVGVVAGTWVADWRAVALLAVLLLARNLWRRRRATRHDRTDHRSCA